MKFIQSKNPISDYKCNECDEELFHDGFPTLSTLMWYSSPEGHNHDDNIKYRLYHCKNNHENSFNRINRCHCGWVGKTEDRMPAATHTVNEWPVETIS